MLRPPLIVLCLLPLAVQELNAQTPFPGTQVAQTYRDPERPEGQLSYLLYLPPSYGTVDKKWPVLVFLHGSGERGTNLELVQKHGPPKLTGREALPFIVVSPQCPRETRWSDPAVFRLLQGMLDDVLRKFSADAERVYLTGLSMGGQGTWYWAAQEPYRFAAIIPICGRAEPSWGERLAHLPTWVFHGAKDPAVNISESEKIVAAIRAAGGDPRFTVYPEAKHDSWTETYANPEIYAWLQSFTKQKEPAKPLVAPKPQEKKH